MAAQALDVWLLFVVGSSDISKHNYNFEKFTQCTPLEACTQNMSQLSNSMIVTKH